MIAASAVGPASVLQGVRLQRGSVIVDLLVAPYDGTASELLTTYANQVLAGESNSLTLHDVVVAAGIDAQHAGDR